MTIGELAEGDKSNPLKYTKLLSITSKFDIKILSF